MDGEILESKMTALTHTMALCCVLREHLDHPLVNAPQHIQIAMQSIGDWVMQTSIPVMEAVDAESTD